MGDEDYENHVIQKFRLVISLAVIKTKPENMTLAEHIQKLKNIVSEDILELDNLSICSDDFLFDDIDDSETNIDKNGNDEGNDDLFTQLSENIEHNTENMIAIDETRNSKTNVDADEDETQIPSLLIENNDKMQILIQQDSNASVTILDNFDVGNEKEDIITVTKEGDNLTDINMNFSSTIPSKFTQYNKLHTEKHYTQCCTDIDETHLEVIDKSADEHIFLSQKYKYGANHNKQSRLEKTIESPNINRENQKQATSNGNKFSEKHAEAVKSLAKCNDKNMYINNDVTSQSPTSNIGSKSGSDPKKNNLLTRSLRGAARKKSDLKAYRHTKEFKNIYKNVADIFSNKQNDGDSKDLGTKTSVKTKTLVNSQDEPNCSQDITTKHITQDFTCDSHYSESQNGGHITIDSKYIHGVKRNIVATIPTSHKKKKKNALVSKDELVSNCVKESTNDITDDENIFLPEKNLESVLIIDKINDSQEPITATNAKTEVSEIILQDSQKTSYITQNDSNQMLTQNNEYTFGISQDLNTIHNPLYKNSQQLNTNDSNIHANNVNLYENDSRLYTCGDLLNVKDTKQTNNVILQNATKVNTDDLIQIIDDNQLNAKDTLSADIQNLTDKKPLNEKNNLNLINKEIEDELFEQSQFKTTCSSGTFQNYISDDSLGLRCSQKHNDFETKNHNISNNNIAFGKNFYYTDKFKTTDLNNSQNTQPQMENSENSRNLVNTNNTENSKTCANFSKKNNVIENINNDSDGISSPYICTDYNSTDEESKDLEAEKVPFKIIEEMSKVKMFLNRRQERHTNSTGYSSDAGYRSDSCSKNSILSQSSNSILDQSAHSLLNYISGCTITATTQDITEEISLVLGQLIDRLHEEEKYPTFLENMLQEIQRILGQIYGNNCEENMLIKEESVHRIILLTKSMHIQKYTIDKITDLLEKFHTDITNKESFEMQNIIEIENICYIFNLLETILQEYKKSQNLSRKIQSSNQETQFSHAAQSLSQNLSQGCQNLSQVCQQLSQGCQNLSQRTQSLSQNSQDEKLLKKSNIMDIWRKKWNPNIEDTQNAVNENKKCVLTHCNTVLNKLVVGCMESYSLISYFALKCFNIMQN